MVREILDGRKTQTRRVIRPQPSNKFIFASIHPDCPDYYRWLTDKRPGCGLIHNVKIPYKVGDRLWVRECWLLNGSANTLRIQYKASDSEYRPDDKRWCGRLVSKHAPKHIIEAQNMWNKHNEKITGHEIPWRSSRFMPKWAARIFLEITNIRVERVQDICEEDAKAEGVLNRLSCENPTDPTGYVEAFEVLWDSLNAKRGYGWDKNSWIWVIEFIRLAL